MTRKDVKQCLDEMEQSGFKRLSFLPATKSYRIDFLFDKRTYKVAPWSAKIAELFSGH